jgi:hypothetical protein
LTFVTNTCGATLAPHASCSFSLTSPIIGISTVTIKATDTSAAVLTVAVIPLRAVSAGEYFFSSLSIIAPFTSLSTDGGESWTQSPMLPAPPSNTSVNAHLNGVSCSSTGLQCVAVGFSATAIETFFVTYTSTDGGMNWVLSTTLPPAQGAGNNQLNGVFCDGTGLQCVTVGMFDNGGSPSGAIFVSNDGGVNWALPTTYTPILT